MRPDRCVPDSPVVAQEGERGQEPRAEVEEGLPLLVVGPVHVDVPRVALRPQAKTGTGLILEINILQTFRRRRCCEALGALVRVLDVD